MKRMLSLALAGAMLVSLAACGGKEPSKSAGSTPPANSSGNTSTVEPVKPPQPESKGNDLDAGNLNASARSNFSGGLALISFTEKSSEQGYAGLIDKDGALQSYVMRAPGESVEYVDGYVYFNSGDASLYVLDQSLETLASYSINKEKGEQLIAYGGGYFIIREKKTGFDASGYIFHIFDSAGKEVNNVTSANSWDEDVSYVGNGVFCFGEYDGSLYFAKSNLWLDGLTLSNSRYSDDGVGYFRFYDDFLIYQGNPYEGEFRYTDDMGTGNSIVVPKEYCDFPICFGETNGLILFQNSTIEFGGETALCTYDTQSGQFKKYQGAYIEHMQEPQEGYWPSCGDGVFAIPLAGADGQIYTVLLNENLEEICEPILGMPILIENGRLYTGADSGHIIYDLQGNELRQTVYGPMPGETGFEVEATIHNNQLYYFDGTEISIDYSTGKLVILPEITK